MIERVVYYLDPLTGYSMVVRLPYTATGGQPIRLVDDGVLWTTGEGPEALEHFVPYHRVLMVRDEKRDEGVTF